MPAPVLQFKRGNAGVAGTVPALRPGEPAISLNNFDFFVGIDTSVANNKFFGSHRYWKRENGTDSLELKLVDKDGTNGVSLRSPQNAGAGVTYTFPSIPDDGKFLSVDGSGNLSWQNVTASASFTNAALSGITTISDSLNNTANTTNSGVTTFTNTTDNTLGNANTGAVQIDGGLGVEKNLTVGANLNVQGYSEFVGVATFRGGTITLGDGTGDNINVGGEFVSGLTPNTDNTYDIGISTQKWRDAYFSGIGSFATGAYIDDIRLGITATNEIDTTSGNLILDSAAGTVEIQDNLTVSGIATITGEFVANGNVTLGSDNADTITINGTTTFNQPLVGTIGTATRALTVDTTTAPSGTFYPGLFVNSTGTASTAVYVDSGISYVSDTDTLTLTGDLAVNGGDLTSTATTFNLINANATTVNAFGAGTAVVLGAATGITTVSNNLTVGGDIRVNGNDIQASDGNANITLTSNTLTTFAGDIKVTGNDIQASDGNTNITMTSNTLTEVKGDLKVTGNDIQSSSATAITLSGADVTVAGDLQVTGNDIKSSTGATALTLSGSNVTVAGDLYVSGSTTQINTTSLQVEDRTIELGLVNGSAPGATTWDLGVLFNYNSSGAKKSGVIWKHADARFKFAFELTADADADPSTTSNPQITITNNSGYAPIEVRSLWINDCAGQHQVISCTGTTRYLNDITIDAGTF